MAIVFGASVAASVLGALAWYISDSRLLPTPGPAPACFPQDPNRSAHVLRHFEIEHADREKVRSILESVGKARFGCYGASCQELEGNPRLTMVWIAPPRFFLYSWIIPN